MDPNIFFLVTNLCPMIVSASKRFSGQCIKIKKLVDYVGIVPFVATPLKGRFGVFLKWLYIALIFLLKSKM